MPNRYTDKTKKSKKIPIKGILQENTHKMKTRLKARRMKNKMLRFMPLDKENEMRLKVVREQLRTMNMVSTEDHREQERQGQILYRQQLAIERARAQNASQSIFVRLFGSVKYFLGI